MLIPIEKGSDNKILRTQSGKITKVTKKTLKFLKDMEETMFKAQGVGLAAPQVGINENIAIALIGGKKVFTLINPVIIEKSEEFLDGEEGCLSLPGHWDKVKRHKWVKVKFMNEKGQQMIMEFTGFNARIVQHEIDHLNAMLFIDRV